MKKPRYVSFFETIEYLKTESFETYANVKYDMLKSMSYSTLVNYFKNNIAPIEELIKFFETTEEYEKCSYLQKNNKSN